MALIKLEQLSGQLDLNRRLPTLAPLPALTAAEPFRKSLARADWSDLAAQSPSVAKARLDVKVVQHRLQTKNAEKWPQLYVRVDQALAQRSPRDAAATAQALCSQGAVWAADLPADSVWRGRVAHWLAAILSLGVLAAMDQLNLAQA